MSRNNNHNHNPRGTHARYAQMYGISPADTLRTAALLRERQPTVQGEKKMDTKVKHKEVEQTEAQKLNPDEDYWILRTDNGAVQYKHNGLSSCCGIVVIHNVSFGNIKEGMKSVFYKEFDEHLRKRSGVNELRGDWDMDRGVLMMSDAVGGESNQGGTDKPCIYDMCTTLGWDISNEYYNPRSGNKVVTFMTAREAYGQALQYPLGRSKWAQQFGVKV